MMLNFFENIEGDDKLYSGGNLVVVLVECLKHIFLFTVPIQ